MEQPSQSGAVSQWQTIYFRDVISFLAVLWPARFRQADSAAFDRSKQLGYKSPNEKLNIAAVGAGGKGYSDITGCKSENIVALVDPDEKRASRAFTEYPNAAKYKDFRQDVRQRNEQHRCGHRLDARSHARHGGDVGDGSRQARVLSEAVDAHGLGSERTDEAARRSTASQRRWATRATRTKARASAARLSGAATSAT